MKEILLTSSVLILALLALRQLFRRTVSRRMQYALWLLVLVRLLVPVNVGTLAHNVLSAAAPVQTVVEERLDTPVLYVQDGTERRPAQLLPSKESQGEPLSPPSDAAQSAPADEYYTVTPTYRTVTLSEALTYVWYAGMAGVGAWFLFTNLRFARALRKARTPYRVEGCRYPVYLVSALPSPCLFGVLRPAVYLNEKALQSPDALRFVLAHEQTHARHLDPLWSLLRGVCLTVYWFDPLVWLAAVLSREDCELACDERVLRGMDAGQVKDYSSALLACSVPRRMLAACPLAFGEVGVGARVKNALRYKKPAFWVVAASVAVCVVVAVCFLTDPEHETMKWAKNLRVDDVVRVELTIMPQATDKQYKDFNADEIAEAVALINKSSGRYISEPESLNGSTMTLYITTADGVQHTVTNNGNIYIRIDGDTYRSTHITWPYTEGDSPLPDSFQVGDTQAADANRFYVDDWSICIVGQWLRNLGTRVWLADNSDAYLSVVKQDSLADELAGLQNAGHAVEELDGYYRCVTQEGLSNTIVYLYPVLSNESCYWVETHWSYDNADESEVEVQATQLRMMAESFRVENESSPADALIGSYADDMGSSLTIRKNADGSYAADLGIYKFTSVGNTVGSYDPQMNILHISGTADIGGTLAADITADGTGRLIVTLTESPVSTGYLAAGAVFTFWPRVTGYSEYDEVLANICDLRLAGTHGTETDFSSDLLTANDYYQTPGWLLRDLDGDGIPELLLGANWDEGHTVIFNIYRSGGTRAVRVVNGWNRNRWYLCTDGSLANEGSSSAFESSYSYYRYTSGELQHLETLLYLDDGSGGSPWRYSVTTDQYVNSGDFHSVTEAEATAVMDKYTHETLAFTPFVV
mgnify:CR=1 FL=1